MKKLLCILIVIVSLFNISIVYADNQIDVGIKDTYDYIDETINNENTKENENEKQEKEINQIQEEESHEFEEIYQNPSGENNKEEENNKKIEEIVQNEIIIENEKYKNSFNLDPEFFDILTDDEKIILNNTYDF